MRVIVQQRAHALFLCRNEQWTPVRSKATEFETVVEAIIYCIRWQARDIKLLGRNDAGLDVYLYPFGGDPAIKSELKKLRTSIRESHRLKTERHLIHARLDSLMAQSKEKKKKQFPFKRNALNEPAGGMGE